MQLGDTVQLTAALECLAELCAPTGPGTPFGTPMLAAADSVRLVVCAAALWVVLRSAVAAATRGLPSQQSWRYASFALYAIATVGTELAHLGDWPHYRLLVLFAATAAAVRGLRRHHHRPTRRVRRSRPGRIVTAAARITRPRPGTGRHAA